MWAESEQDREFFQGFELIQGHPVFLPRVKLNRGARTDDNPQIALLSEFLFEIAPSAPIEAIVCEDSTIQFAEKSLSVEFFSKPLPLTFGFALENDGTGGDSGHDRSF